MSYTVNITYSAKQDLRSIALNIAAQSGETEIARDFVRRLRDKCLQLTDFPNACAVPSDYVLRCMGYRFVVYKDYLIFYLVDESESTVNITAIFNSRMDYIRIMVGRI